MGAFDRFRVNKDGTPIQPMGVRNYIKPGDHYLLVRRATQRQSTNPQKKGNEITVVEFKVLQSDTMRVGEVTSLVETELQQGYFGNVLAFVAGALGYGIEEIQADPDFDEIFDGIFGGDQVLVDMVVHCVAQQVATTSPQAKSKEYTAKTFEAVDARDYAKWGLIAPDGAYVDPNRHDEAAETGAAA